MQIPVATIPLLLLLLSFGPRAAAQENLGGSGFFGRVIAAVRYEADQPVEHRDSAAFQRLRPGDTLTRTSLKEAIQALYDTGKFSHIEVAASELEAGVEVRFVLRWNYYFNEFSMRGGIDLGGRTLGEVVPMPVGERYRPAKLEQAREAVLNFLRDHGYFGAAVEARVERDEFARQINTVFDVTPGELASVSSFEIAGIADPERNRIRERLGLSRGRQYKKDRIQRRLEELKRQLQEDGFLEATATLAEEFDPSTNQVALTLRIENFGQYRVAVDGFKIPRDQLRRLLPVLSGGSVEESLIEEGVTNLREYLENRGYPQAEVTVRSESDASGVRILRHVIEPGERVTVTHVGFLGNSVFEDRDLQDIIQIQPSGFLRSSVYSIQKLDADVEALESYYRSAGHLDARIIPVVEPGIERDQLRITFEIAEGPLFRVHQLSLSGNQTLENRRLLTGMKLSPGGAYSPHLVEGDRQSILAAYNNEGFLQPRVSYNIQGPDAENSYSVEFTIREGARSYVDRILVIGNRRTRDSVIERRLRLKEKEPLSLGKMLETQQSLYRMGIFDQVRVGPQDPESPAVHQDVIVRLQESRQIITGYGIGYQETEGPRGTLELRHLNIFGTGRRADFRLRGSEREQGVLLNFQQPTNLPLPLDSYFSFSARRKREVSFDVRRINLGYQFARAVGNHSWTLFRYNFKNVRVSNLAISESELTREDMPRNLSSLSFIYVNDTRDNFLDAERGFFSSTDLSVTAKALGSDSNFISLYTQNTYHRRLPLSLLLGSSAQMGVARAFGSTESIPISERFFAGGGSSLRGFETDRAGPLDPKTGQPLGGNFLIIGNLEVKIPLWGYFQLAGFYDTGNVFRKTGDFRLSGFSHTLGLGLRLKTPFGPVRLDYGFNLNLPQALRLQGFSNRQLFISIGPAF